MEASTTAATSPHIRRPRIGLGCPALALGALGLALSLRSPIGVFDEGLLLTNAGLALGVVGDLRHDLLAYLVLAALVFAVARACVTRELALRAVLVPVSSLALGALVTLVPVWWPIVSAAGWERVALDLDVEQSRVLAARALPLFARSGWRSYQWMFLLEGVAPMVALVLLGRGAWSNGVAVLGALALAALPASLGRTDASHVAGSASPARILFAMLGLRWFESCASQVKQLAIGGVLRSGAADPSAGTLVRACARARSRESCRQPPL